MDYQVLARKWRPQNFSEVVAQTHVVRALQNSIKSGRLHHAYLFTGTRGVGKTSIARILAKCFNCEKGVTATPCDTCSQCVALREGRFVDLIEVDAASRAKVEETRELLDNVQYAPTTGRYKVYLIDEVHMFSNHSFNALLKTLEEPPPYVVFLLATTEADRIPITILSRCLQFHLGSLGSEEIKRQLEHIVGMEQVKTDQESLAVVARAANGSMRDALSLLDLAISHGNGDLQEDAVRTLFGFVGREQIREIMRALGNHDGSLMLATAAAMDQHTPNYEVVLSEIATILQQTAILQVVGETEAHCEDAELKALLQHLAERLDREEVQLLYQIALLGHKDLPFSPSQRIGFEMTLIRMLAFLPTPRAMDAAPSGNAPAAHRVAMPTMPTPSTDSTTAAVVPRLKQSERAIINSSEEWAHTIQKMGLVGLTRELAEHSILEQDKDEANCYILCLSPEHRSALSKKTEEDLKAAFVAHYGNGTRLRVVFEARRKSKAPATLRYEATTALQQEAEVAVEHDPNIQLLRELFDAKVDHGSIKPASSKGSDNN